MKKERASFLSELKRILAYSKGFKLSFILIFIFSVLAAIFSVLTPYLLGLITTSLFDSVKNHISINYDYIYKIMIILLILYLFYAGLNYFKSYIAAKMGADLTYKLRYDLTYKFNTLEIKTIEKRKKGDLISLSINDVEKISDFFSDSLPELVYHFVQMIGIIFMMCYISIKLSLITFITFPVALFILSLIIKRTQKYFDLNQSTLGSVNAKIEESIYNDLIIKSYNKEEYFIENFNKENELLKKYNFKSNLYSGIAFPIINFVNNLNYCIIIAIGAYLCIKGNMKVGSIQAFVTYMQQFSRPIAMLGEILSSLEATAAASKRIFKIIDEEDGRDGHITKFDNPELISIKNVSFAYEKENVLNDISFDIKKGSQVAIVGPTGSGKTTLINLLLNFYEVSEGKILFDNINISDIKKSALRNKTALVLQDPWIWEGTIKENITMGKHYKEEEIKEALKDSNLTHIVKSLPNGMDFKINENSDNVSTGEKQLITIARALLTKPDILILDEATSNVDVRTEYLIHESLKKLMKNRTRLVIAHRLSTITNSDKIIVLNNGKIEEVGTHKSLIKKKGFYYNLYKSGFEK